MKSSSYMRLDIPEYFNGSFIKLDKIYYRRFQHDILNKCQNKNSLVVLPTGLGKTIIGVLLIAERLKKYKTHGKILVLAPTRPLVSQHESSVKAFLDIEDEQVFQLTGKIRPEKRTIFFEKAKIIISTPQVIKNDLMRGYYDLKHVSLVIFDEAHRTKGNYAYTFISKEYIRSCVDPLILGLTASPGKNLDLIQELCDNLFVENVVFKSLEDPDVEEYIHGIDVIVKKIELPIKIFELRGILNHLFDKYLRFFIKNELINSYKRYYSKMDFLRITHDITTSLRQGGGLKNDSASQEEMDTLFFQDPRLIDVIRKKNLNIQAIFSYCSSCISILHARELLETQGIGLFNSFLERIETKSKHDITSAKRIVDSKHFKYIQSVINKEEAREIGHPKIDEIHSVIAEEKESFKNCKLIIFTQYREMAQLLKKTLREKIGNDYRIEKFIGQASKTEDLGYSQNKQIEILNEFRKNKIDILIATSVAEEGLDIPNVDAVVFYEPVPSEIRFIQRRGRTGRMAPGRCYVIMAEDTVDIAYYNVSRRKENTMKEVLLDPEALELNNDIKRKNIVVKDSKQYSDYELLKRFEEKRKREKELLANRSIDEILEQLDNFKKSKEYKKMKKLGVAFYSDVVQFNPKKMRNNNSKPTITNGTSEKPQKKIKRYLNKNVQTLISLAKTYSESGKISYLRYQKLAEDEEIIDRKFHTHFNRACYLGYLEHKADHVYFLKDYDQF